MKRLLLLTACLIIVFGCAAPPEVLKTPYLVWPMPPAKPRIQFLVSYNNTLDITEYPGFMDRVAGYEIYRLESPQGVAADREGNIYVADSTRHVIVVFMPQQKKMRFIGNRERDFERVVIPIGLDIAHNEKMLLVASAGSRKIIGYDIPTGNTKLVISGFTNPVGVAVDEERGRIYVTDSKAHELKAFDIKGQYINTIASRGTEDHQLFVPSQVSLDREGNIYVADSFNFKIKIFSPDGTLINTIGKGVGDSPGYFDKLNGVAVDSDGNIYAVDTAFNNFQIFNTEGQLLLFVGRVGTRVGRFNLPMYIHIDEQDRIYIADSFNSRVQVFQYISEDESTVAPSEN